jgi:hypothetical protein
MDAFFTLGWLPSYYLHGDFTPETPIEYLDNLSLRFGLVSSKENIINIGFELSFSLYSFSPKYSLLVENNLLLRSQFRNHRMALMLRLGAGLILPSVDQDVPAINTLDTRAIYANTSLSLLWLPFKKFYIETGAKYSHVFAVDNHFGIIRPFVGFGIQLGMSNEQLIEHEGQMYD